MKTLKFGLRIWITIASVASFVLGWIMLVHAPKPPQFAANVSSPTLEPLPPLFELGSSNNFTNRQFSNIQPQMRPRAFFRTGGS